MLRTRLVIAAVLSLLVVTLLTWQILRERRQAACLASGGAWNGPASRCEPIRAPIIERDGLRRT